MWLRINYFPLLLSFFLNVKLELYYVVPLHTAAFFITMFTCLLAQRMEAKMKWTRDTCNLIAIALCVLVHVVFYQTKLSQLLETLFSHEYYFRFSSDKYSPVVGIISGFLWKHFQAYMQWCYKGENGPVVWAQWAQRGMGILLIALWWILFGHIKDKFIYNPMHPYVFWMPVAGWLMLRNSSKYMCELHSGALEFFGRITLETYVLQFHVFMCQNVQHIPVVIPGSMATDGNLFLQTLNMLLCGTIFVTLAYFARSATVTTQTSVTELMMLLSHGPTETDEGDLESAPLNKAEGSQDSETTSTK